MELKENNIIISKTRENNFVLYPLNNEKGGSLEIGKVNFHRLKNGGAGYLFNDEGILKVYELSDGNLNVSFGDREGKNRVVYEAEKSSYYNDPAHEGQWQTKLKKEHIHQIVSVIK